MPRRFIVPPLWGMITLAMVNSKQAGEGSKVFKAGTGGDFKSGTGGSKQAGDGGEDVFFLGRQGGGPTIV